MEANIMGNTITGNSEEGIDVYNYQDDDYDDYGYAGMDLNIGDGTAAGVNTISGNFSDGIYISNDAEYYSDISEGPNAYVDVTILGNTISGNFDDGIHVVNTDSYEYGDGAYAVTDVNIGDGTLLGANTITGNNGDGIYLDNYSYDGQSDLNAVILGNTITGNTGSGVNVYNSYDYGDAYFDGKMEGNVVTGNSGYAVNLYNDDSFNMDMGGGDGGPTEDTSLGNNSFYGNLGYGDGYATDIYNDSVTNVYAENNWWGADADPYDNGQIYNDDGYDTYVDLWLSVAP